MKKLMVVAVFIISISCSDLTVCFGEEPIAVKGMDEGIEIQAINEKNDEEEIQIRKEIAKLPVTKIALALYYIKTLYYKEVDMDKCLEQIMEDGISGCTDQYSRFVDDKGVEREDIDSEGFYKGVGIKYEVKDGTTTIAYVYPNSPAGALGMKAGDEVSAISPTGVEIDSVSVAGLDWDRIAELLDGKKSNKLAIIIKRNGKSITFIVEKGLVKDDSVFFTKLDKGIGYVGISGFIETTENDFGIAVSSLIKNGVRVLIIDLRNNPGGSLRSVVNIIGLFQINNDPVVYTQSRGKAYESITSNSKNHGIFKDMKVVVLVNEKSASAAEIMSGWLKEDGEATVIGQSTYGKDLVQSLLDFPDGSRLHLTTSQYFIGARKVSIGKVGVQPSIKVKLSNNPKDKTDYQLKKAITIAFNKLVSSFLK